MNLHGELLAADVYGFIYLLALVGLVFCIRHAPWAVLNEAAKINAWLGASIVVAAVWLLKAGVRPNLHLHLLGATALTLMVGPYLALLGLLLVLLALTWLGIGDWQNLALNWLLMAWTPVGATYVLLRLCQRYLPPNYFVYIFINAFIGGALVVVGDAWLIGCDWWRAVDGFIDVDRDGHRRWSCHGDSHPCGISATNESAVPPSGNGNHNSPFV